MLTQHNQEFRRYIPDPLSLLGVGSGHETKHNANVPCPATWSMRVTRDSFLAGKMSLFDCGFRRISRSENSETEQQSIVTPPHVPSVEDSGLGRLR